MMHVGPVVERADAPAAPSVVVGGGPVRPRRLDPDRLPFRAAHIMPPPGSPPEATEAASTMMSRVAAGGSAAAGGSSFLWPMRLLPAAQRAAMFALYGYCRMVDDCVDLPGATVADKAACLAGWRARLEELAATTGARGPQGPQGPQYQGIHDEGKDETMAAAAPSTPLECALSAAIARFELSLPELLAVMDGVAMDLGTEEGYVAAGAICAPDWSCLQLYCRRVAGAVGILSVQIFGRADAVAGHMAIALGEAMQLTNILRDVHEDARLGRLYLPREVLEEAGIEDRDPGAVLAHPRLSHACALVAGVAFARYREARSLLDEDGDRRLWPALAMLLIYRRLLLRLVRRGWCPSVSPGTGDKITRRTGLWRWEPVWLTLRCRLACPPRG